MQLCRQSYCGFCFPELAYTGSGQVDSGRGFEMLFIIIDRVLTLTSWLTLAGVLGGLYGAIFIRGDSMGVFLGTTAFSGLLWLVTRLIRHKTGEYWL